MTRSRRWRGRTPPAVVLARGSFIEALQTRIQTMQADHNRQMAEVERKHRREIADKEARHKQEISFLKTVIARAAASFPYFSENTTVFENLCRLVGFSDGQMRNAGERECHTLYVLILYGKFHMTQKIFFLFFGIIIWYLFLQSGIRRRYLRCDTCIL